MPRARPRATGRTTGRIATARVLTGPASLRASDHACLVCSTREQELAALAAFFEEGRDLGERCVYVASRVADSKLALAGIAVVVIGLPDAAPGAFDPERMLDWLRGRTSDALRSGGSGFRFAIDAECVMQDPNRARWAEYESRLNQLMPSARLAVMCTYDRARLAPQIVRDMLATHPLVMTDGIVCHNPHYVVPEDFLASDRPAGEVDRFVEQLRASHRADAERREAADRRRALARGLRTAAEAERRAVSRSLRDDVAHTLSAIELAIERGDNPRDTGALVARALARVTALQHELRPTILDELGLVAAIYAHATAEAQRAGFELVLELDDLGVDGDAATACYRIVREALANVVRHARASKVEISLQAVAGWLELVVRDDGAGFDPSLPRTTFGLLDMAERAELLDGNLEISSAIGSGTTVFARIAL